jgi:hypothetical protein
LEVLAGRRVVQVDGVSFEDIVTMHYNGVDVLVESASVERGVVEAADGEGYGVCDRRQKVATLRISCWVRAICALRPKRKPRPLFRPREFRPPRLPRSHEASAWVLSSLLDIVIRVVLIFLCVLIGFLVKSSLDGL